MTPVLTEAARFAPHTVEVFLDADTPDTAAGNRFAGGAWGTLTTRLRPVAHYAATLSATGPAAVPSDWAQRRATVYVCYPFQDLEAAAPLVAAVVGGLLRRLMAEDKATRAARGRVLLLLDEAPAVALPGLAGRLATMGGLGITAAVYCQSVSQLAEVYGPHAAETILSNLTHQAFWAPRDPETARRLAEAFGTELVPTFGFSGGGGDTQGWGSAPAGLSSSGGQSAQNGWQVGVRERPALDVAAVQALPPGTVAVLTGGKKTLAYDSKTLFGGDRVGAFLATLPPPPDPASVPRPTLALPAPAAATPPATPAAVAPAASASPTSPPPSPAPRRTPKPAPAAARPRRTARSRTAPKDIPRPW
jgi:hypothetical protein